MAVGFCHACGAPLQGEYQGPSPIYCGYCTDEEGTLKPRAQIHRGIASWLQTWQPGIDNAIALRRAESYMKAMPAWAEAPPQPAVSAARPEPAKKPAKKAAQPKKIRR